MGVPAVIVDGPSGVVKVGEELTLTCYATNSEELQIEWLMNGELLEGM